MNKEEPIHLCLQYRGKGEGCELCKIREMGLCGKLIQCIGKWNSWLSEFDFQTRKEIIANTIKEIIKSIDGLRETSKFISWANVIFSREKKKIIKIIIKLSIISIDDVKETRNGPLITSRSNIDKKIDAENLINKLKEFVHSDNRRLKECARLLLDVFRYKYKEGVPEREIADRRGKDYRLWRKQKQRCLALIKQMLQQEDWKC